MIIRGVKKLSLCCPVGLVYCKSYHLRKIIAGIDYKKNMSYETKHFSYNYYRLQVDHEKMRHIKVAHISHEYGLNSKYFLNFMVENRVLTLSM